MQKLLELAAHKKLIILDPSLKSIGGHYYEYNAAIGAAALRRKMPTWVFAHKSCDTAALAMPVAEIHPWFSTEWSATGGRTRKAARLLLAKLPIAFRIPLVRLGRLVWNLIKERPKKVTNQRTAALSEAAKKFGTEAIDALRRVGCSSEDLIFVPTIRTSELFALYKSVQSACDLPPLQFHIVLRRDAAEMDLPEAGTPGISFLFREMNADRAGKAFHFYCDTQQLCDDYAALSLRRLKFRLLPIPFPHIDPDPTNLEKWSSGTAVKLVYLGGARVEKGFHLLSQAELFLRKKHSAKLLWRLQAPTGEILEEPEVTAARRHLLTIPDENVELIERNLTSSEFQSLLLSADIVLLPYLPEFYRARSSGILVQALAAGKPVVVAANTWLSNQTNGLGAVEFMATSDFPEALLKAVQRLPQLSNEAQNRAAGYAALHSADALLRVLVDTQSPMN